MALGTEVGLTPGDFDGAQLPPPKKEAPQFSAHVCCGQTVGWIMMPHGTEVGLGTSHIVLDVDPAVPMERGTAAPPPLWPMSIVTKRSPISLAAELLLCLYIMR